MLYIYEEVAVVEKLTAYAVSITRRDGKTSMTWCTDYRFDPEKETVTLIGVRGDVVGTVNMQDEDFARVDIYDEQKPMDRLVQTILAKAR